MAYYNQGEDCKICLSPYLTPIEVLPCQHSMCLTCYQNLEYSAQLLTCPFCRGPIEAWKRIGIFECAIFNMKEILSHTGRGTNIQYLILWSTGAKTWEPRENISLDLLQEYRRRRVAANTRRWRLNQR